MVRSLCCVDWTGWVVKESAAGVWLVAESAVKVFETSGHRTWDNEVKIPFGFCEFRQ